MIHPPPRQDPVLHWFAILDTDSPIKKKPPYPNPQQLATIAQDCTRRCCFTGHTDFPQARACGLTAFPQDTHLYFAQIPIPLPD